MRLKLFSIFYICKFYEVEQLSEELEIHRRKQRFLRSRKMKAKVPEIKMFESKYICSFSEKTFSEYLSENKKNKR